MQRIDSVKVELLDDPEFSKLPRDDFLLALTRTPNGERLVALTKSWTLVSFVNGKMVGQRPLTGRDARGRARLHLLTARSGVLYVVLSVEDTVQFYDAASLDFAREFHPVKDLQVGDLWSSGSDQARLVLADGSEVVTDLGPAPFLGKPDGKAARESCSALSRQLTAAKGAVSDAFADVAAVDNLIDSFCSEINSASRPSSSDNELVAKIISTGGSSASVLWERASFVHDLHSEWNPGRLAFWARHFAY